MKKIFYYINAFCLFTALMASCSSEEDVVGDDNGHLRKITMIASDFIQEDGSRTSINIGPSGGSFAWASNDTVGIFPNEGGQVYFPMVNGAGTKTASFDGGGWALKSNSTYAAYYPYDIRNNDLSYIPMSFEGQVQNGNNSTAHLGKYDFMAAQASTPVNGGVNFAFKHLACVVQLSVKVPKAGPLTSVTLTANSDIFYSDAFITKGWTSLDWEDPSINSETTSSSIKIDLKNVSATTDGQIVNVYFMMAPVNLEYYVVKATIVNGGTSYSCDVLGTNKDFMKGKCYQMKVYVPQGPSTVEWVDLGLPSGTLWASHNVGATKPEEYGERFAWGETSPKATYTKENSLTWNKPMPVSDISGDPRYDAATASWGAPIRIPTQKDFQELCENCAFTQDVRNGVEGYKFMGEFDSEIFIPANGYIEGNTLNEANINGYYWSSTTFNHSWVWGAFFQKEQLNFNWRYCHDRYLGLNIRPVCNIK